MSDPCAGCGASLPALALSCPSCNRLVHTARLTELAAQAKSAAAQSDGVGARQAWQTALSLLPPESVQYQSIQARLAELAASETPAAPQAEPESHWKRRLAWLGPFGLLIWKLKTVALFALGKAKFLLLGLKSLTTFGSMAASIGLYWTQYGWKFALGLVLSIYVHEMGHVWKLKQYGIPASAPLFIPGFGAFIRVKAMMDNAVHDARVGLAGPIWGLGAALACAVYGAAAESNLALSLAAFGAWINIFNLTPVWQLDGGRGFRSFTRQQRILASVAILVTWIATGQGLLFIVLLGAAYRTLLQRDHASEPDWNGFIQYVGLIVVLGVIAGVGVPSGI